MRRMERLRRTGTAGRTGTVEGDDLAQYERAKEDEGEDQEKEEEEEEH